MRFHLKHYVLPVTSLQNETLCASGANACGKRKSPKSDKPGFSQKNRVFLLEKLGFSEKLSFSCEKLGFSEKRSLSGRKTKFLRKTKFFSRKTEFFRKTRFLCLKNENIMEGLFSNRKEYTYLYTYIPTYRGRNQECCNNRHYSCTQSKQSMKHLKYL